VPSNRHAILQQRLSQEMQGQVGECLPADNRNALPDRPDPPLQPGQWRHSVPGGREASVSAVL